LEGAGEGVLGCGRGRWGYVAFAAVE